MTTHVKASALNLSPSRGFTILEVVCVLVILGVLASVAFSRTSGMWISAYGDADRLVSDLRYVHSLAMTQAYPLGGDKAVGVEITNDGWEFTNGGDHTWRFADGSTEREFRWGVSVDSNHTVEFEYPGGSPNGNTEIELSRGGNTITIQVYEETGYVGIKQ